MVTSILIARPAGESRVDISNKTSSGVSGNAQLSGNAAKVPIDGGLEGGRTFAQEFGLKFVPKTPFIYGFKVRERYYKEKQGGSSEKYYKGAKMHADGETAESGKREEPDDIVFGSYQIADGDLDLDLLGDAGEKFQQVAVIGDNRDEAWTLVARKV